MNLKDYDKMWTNKVIQADMDFAKLYVMDNIVSKDDPLIGAYSASLMGGVRVRKYPMIGTDTQTYAPSIYAVNDLVSTNGFVSGAGKKKTNNIVSDFGTGFRDGFVGTAKMVGEAATAVAPLAPLLMLAAGKADIELEKAKESLKKFINNERKTKPSKKHLQLLEANGIISKKGEDKLEAGKINRLKKGKKWAEFAINTASSGLDLAERAKAIVGGKINRLKKGKK